MESRAPLNPVSWHHGVCAGIGGRPKPQLWMLKLTPCWESYTAPSPLPHTRLWGRRHVFPVAACLNPAFSTILRRWPSWGLGLTTLRNPAAVVQLKGAADVSCSAHGRCGEGSYCLFAQVQVLLQLARSLLLLGRADEGRYGTGDCGWPLSMHGPTATSLPDILLCCRCNPQMSATLFLLRQDPGGPCCRSGDNTNLLQPSGRRHRSRGA
jgi:hypothetical protein